MLFTTETISNDEIRAIDNFFNEFEGANESVETVAQDEVKETVVVTYLHSLVTSCYKKSVEDIANTKIGNKVVRKRSLQQVMQESFFYGSNRFGNNFIA